MIMMRPAAMMELERFRDHGLLAMRVGIGLMFAIVHGWPKLIGGPERWAKLGGAMKSFGIDFAPEFWGFMAAFAEFAGGIALALGLLTRPFLALLIVTMVVAAVKHLAAGDGLKGSSHSIEVGFAFLGLFFTGPGKLSLDWKLFGDSDDD